VITCWRSLSRRTRSALRGLQRLQGFFPLSLEAARHETVVGIDGAIAALGALGFITGAFHGESPLLERRVAIRLEPLGGGDRCGELCRFQGGDEGFRDGVADLDAADTEAIDAAALDQRFAGAMISGNRFASAIVGVQAASAVAAAGETLQEGAAFSHGAPALVRLRSRVLRETLLIGFISSPVDGCSLMKTCHSERGKHRMRFLRAPEESRIVSWRVLP
jgi:hypothetical protein